jgi:hypothetical protein
MRTKYDDDNRGTTTRTHPISIGCGVAEAFILDMRSKVPIPLAKEMWPGSYICCKVDAKEKS